MSINQLKRVTVTSGHDPAIAVILREHDRLLAELDDATAELRKSLAVADFSPAQEATLVGMKDLFA